MSKKYRIEYLPIAQKDLEEILEYIQNDNPGAVLKLLDQVDKAVSQLADFPFMGIIPKDFYLQYRHYRMLVVNSYLVFYIVTNDIVEIQRILHGKRKYSFLL